MHTCSGGSEASEEVEGGRDIHSMQENVAYIFFFSLLFSPLFLLGRQKTFSCSAEQSEGRKDKGLAGFNTSFSVSMREGGKEGGKDTGNEVGAVAMAPFSKGRVKRTRTNQRIPMGWGRRREGESRGPTIQERERERECLGR